MLKETLLAICILTAGFIFSSGYVWQIYKAFKTKSTNDISKGMVIKFTIGTFLYIVYFLFYLDRLVLVANFFGLFCLITLLILIFKYK